MTLQTQWLRLFQQEDLNFLLTNRVPRRLLTLFVGWLSKIEQPLVRDASIGLWKVFSGLDLSEAKKRKTIKRKISTVIDIMTEIMVKASGSFI